MRRVRRDSIEWGASEEGWTIRGAALRVKEPGRTGTHGFCLTYGAGLPRVGAPAITPAMSFRWSTQRVVVTGGAGFLGSFVLEELRRRGAEHVFVPRSKDYDLVDMAAVKRLY